MSEIPLGTSGQSRYGINLNLQTSPVYYIFAQANIGNFTPTEPVVWLTTSDFASFDVTSAEISMSADGIFEFPMPPIITQPPQSQTVLSGKTPSINVTATGSSLSYQWFLNNNGISGASASVLNLSSASTNDAGSYLVVVTNSLGSATSGVANLTVVLPPSLKMNISTSGGIQLNASSITGLTYIVESSTNLNPPFWLPILTNNTGNSGTVNFQTNVMNNNLKFYRLVFP